MKYIKKYEEINIEEPEIGDYVLCEESCGNSAIENYTSKYIGQIYHISFDKKRYYIKYDNIPKDLKYHFSLFPQKYIKNSDSPKYSRYMHKYEIKYWAKTKEDIEIYFAQKKYNI